MTPLSFFLGWFFLVILFIACIGLLICTIVAFDNADNIGTILLCIVLFATSIIGLVTYFNFHPMFKKIDEVKEIKMIVKPSETDPR